MQHNYVTQHILLATCTCKQNTVVVPAGKSRALLPKGTTVVLRQDLSAPVPFPRNLGLDSVAARARTMGRALSGSCSLLGSQPNTGNASGKLAQVQLTSLLPYPDWCSISSNLKSPHCMIEFTSSGAPFHQHHGSHGSPFNNSMFEEAETVALNNNGIQLITEFSKGAGVPVDVAELSKKMVQLVQQSISNRLYILHKQGLLRPQDEI